MARLNEPPVAPAPSQEAFDAVKRKFMRTNRELAKINSQQQVHIRTLENDRSRLVAENCSLAQQILHLQNTLETYAHAPSFSTIDTVKNQLEAKIQELGGLVAELGQLNKRGGSGPCRVQTATRKGPDERVWRSALGLQEVEHAMMPTITEYKVLPRMTMNAEELQDMLDAPDSQSPDIGPPPVSHFDIEEPITFNRSPAPQDEPETPADDEEPALPMNLETRRKRRESGPKISVRRMSVFEPPPEEPQEEPVKTFKTGAKRKFSVQEDEDKGHAQLESFQFSRRNTPVPTDDGKLEENRLLSPRRPILSSKPVNTDPVVSPKKQRSSAPEKPEKKKPSRSRLTVTREIQPDVISHELSEPIATTEIHLDSLPPKTPAAEAILSPPSTEPSISRPESKDTPPPGDLTSMSQTGIIGRPSRRARPQVSYKEPSLNTKMRRPNKELVDAVIADQTQRTSVEPPTSAPLSAHIIIKEEPEDSPCKPLSTADVLSGGDAAELGSPLRQKLDRREESRPERQKLNSEKASHAISAMIEETRRKSLTSAGLPSGKETVDESRSQSSRPRPESESDMAVFDFNESSPATAAPTSRPKISLASAVRQGRRHSSVPASVGVENRRVETTSSRADGNLPAVHKRSGSGVLKTAPAAGLAKSTAAVRSSMKERERRGGAVPLSGDSRARGESGDGVRESRSERAASRRKSMMV